MRRVGIEVSDLPTYEGLPNLAYFLTEFEEKISKHQRLSALDFALKATPDRWWITHKESILEKPQCQRLMEIRLGEEIGYISKKYTGLTNPVEHIEYCRATWEVCPRQEWIH